MRMPGGRASLTPGRGGTLLAGVGIAFVVAVAALWLATLLRPTGDSGSLDARVTAVGATVRCPVCKEPIPLNDVQNQQAIQMRQFIRAELQRGRSEDQVRQELVDRYGVSILLAPPQQGFDLLAWAIPLAAVVACAVAVLLALRRWSRHGDADLLTRPLAWSEHAPSTGPAFQTSTPDARRYEELLDQELARRE